MNSKRYQKIFMNNSLPGVKVLENGLITGTNDQFSESIEVNEEIKGNNFMQ